MASDTPPVRCTSCDARWNSAAMVDGLRLLGSCPRCGAASLVFRDTAAEPVAEVPADAPASGGAGLAPHLVLGVPRR